MYITHLHDKNSNNICHIPICTFDDARTNSEQFFKMFVACHKECKMVQNDHLKYIHVGAFRGHISTDILRDDVGDNISHRNNKYCELTGQYWVWKNLDLDYYGFCHYRRFLSFSNDKLEANSSGDVVLENISEDFTRLMGYDKDFNDIIKSYDIIVGTPYDTRVDNISNLYWQYKMGDSLHIEDLDCMIQVLSEKYPEYIHSMKKYIDGHMFYPCNMFIMSKDVFNDYSEWLFDILFEVERRLDYTNYSNESMRVLGHLGERLLGIYITHSLENGLNTLGQVQRCFIKNTEVDCPRPVKCAIPVLLSCNDYYAPYLGSTVLSLAKNTDSLLDLIVMNRDISEPNITLIKNLLKEYPHTSIRFINISSHLERYPLLTHEHISVDTFSRLLIPIILKDYEKIIYLDSDLIVVDDISKLYSTDLRDNIIAGVIDIGYVSLYNRNDERIVNSACNTLKLADPYKYINAGVLLIDVKKLCKKYPGDYLIDYAAKHDYMYMDQDVINKLFEGDIAHLDQSWNTMHYHSGERKELIDLHAPIAIREEYLQARENPKIIHYAGNRKPWNDEYEDFAKEYWSMISGTLLYNIIFLRRLNQNNDSINSPPGEHADKIRHKILSRIISKIDKKYPYPIK